MITISSDEVAEAGGFLAALTQKSCYYLRSLLKDSDLFGFDGDDAKLENIIVHTSPHLDEYFAELVFRLCLENKYRTCGFFEQTIFSKKNDLACRHLWPTAAVMGIGGAISGGAKPLFIFDEHEIDLQFGKSVRTASSCSELVIRRLIKVCPNSFSVLLQEVNAIDEYGNAHQQHLGNLIKTFHEVKFLFGDNAQSGYLTKDVLTAEWKRAIIDSCLTAVVYCLENQIDLLGHPADKNEILEQTLCIYQELSPHRENQYFSEAIQWIRSNFLNQSNVFDKAFLKDDSDIILKDFSGNPIPQLLLLSRVCFSLHHCWGVDIRDIVMTHFWEVVLQGQISFYQVKSATKELFDKNLTRYVSPAGFLRKMILPPIDIGRNWRCPLWIVSIVPDGSILLPHRGITNYVNENNSIHALKDVRSPGKGCGLILVQDSVKSTCALFKCVGLPESMWRKIVELIVQYEEECWYVMPTRKGGIADFIINGNRAHQYVPRTGLDLDVLYRLARSAFY